MKNDFLPSAFSNTRISLFKRLLKTLDGNSVQINSVIDIGSTYLMGISSGEITQAVEFVKSSFGVSDCRHIDEYSYFYGNSLSVGTHNKIPIVSRKCFSKIGLVLLVGSAQGGITTDKMNECKIV